MSKYQFQRHLSTGFIISFPLFFQLVSAHSAVAAPPVAKANSVEVAPNLSNRASPVPVPVPVPARGPVPVPVPVSAPSTTAPGTTAPVTFVATTPGARRLVRLGIADGAAPFLDLSANRIEFATPRSLAGLPQKWALRNTSRIVVAHFGDSHIQNGSLPKNARARLQSGAGDAGRGMVFPYTIARTYSQNDYASTFTGVWRTANSIQQPPRLPVGVSGFVAQTSDLTASFTLSFSGPLSPGPKVIKVLQRSTANGYRLSLIADGVEQNIVVPASATPRSEFLSFNLNAPATNLTFRLSRQSLDAGSFELHGISIENPQPGLIYHNLGVGGAAFPALLQQRLFDEQIGLIQPDLVVLDWGTNDILYTNTVPAEHASRVRATIARIRAALPNAAIVLTSTQEMRFRNRTITSAAEYSQLMRALAQETDCLFYDWYRVAGGVGAAQAWVDGGLGGRDFIHLKWRGYRLKGDLFAQALLEMLTPNSTQAAAMPRELGRTAEAVFAGPPN